MLINSTHSKSINETVFASHQMIYTQV